MTKTALIFGVSGQDGAYLAAFLLNRGYVVHGTSRDAELSRFANLEQLQIRDRVHRHSAAPTDFRSVLQAISRAEPDEIYNLAGQSSVGLSFEQPVETMESIALGTINILEAIRFLDRPIRFYNAGSGECFGNTENGPANVDTAFNPRSPYAVAKAAAKWAVSNYRDAYDMYACSGILFNHESPLRPLRFVTRKLVRGAASIAAGKADTLSLGDLSIRRDWGWAPEYVEAMWLMLQRDQAEDFVIATGESHSLEDFTRLAFDFFGLDWRDHVSSDKRFFRPSEIRCGMGDVKRTGEALGWQATTKLAGVVEKMARAEQAELANSQ